MSRRDGLTVDVISQYKENNTALIQRYLRDMTSVIVDATCAVCLEPVKSRSPGSRPHYCEYCSCTAHASCMSSYVRFQLENFGQVLCPGGSCGHVFSSSEIHQYKKDPSDNGSYHDVRVERMARERHNRLLQMSRDADRRVQERIQKEKELQDYLNWEEQQRRNWAPGAGLFKQELYIF